MMYCQIVLQYKNLRGRSKMKKSRIRFKKYLAARILVFAMILSVLSTTSYAGRDEPSVWAKDLVESAIKKGYVPKNFQSGYQNPITQLEAAQLFTAYLEYLTGDKAEDIIRKSRIITTKGGMFKDTSDRAAELTAALEICEPEYRPKFDLSGEIFEKGTFGGNTVICKQFGVFLFTNFLKALGAMDSGDADKDQKSLAAFKDLTGDLFGRDYYAFIINHGIMSGSSKDQFNLDAKLTREQVIGIIEKIDRSELKNGFYSYFNTYSPRSGSLYPYHLESLPNAIQFPYRGKGAAYLFSIGRGNDGWHKQMTLKLPEQKQDITLDNRDFYQSGWAFEVATQLADALADEHGNIHVAFVLRTAMFNEEFDQSKVPMLIIRSYSPSGKTLSTNKIYAKNISGLKNLGRFADYGSFEMEYKNGTYRIFAIAENIGRTERRAVVMTVKGGNATAEYVLGNPKALVREQDVIYSETFGGYVYAILANEGEERGYNIVLPNGKVYNTFHIWQKPNFSMKNSDDFDSDLYADLGGIVDTTKGLMLVGAANREISSGALTGNRDVFVQVITKEQTSSSISSTGAFLSFFGGEERTGISNLPSEKTITDKGVIWLTQLSKNEVALDPKLVKVGENIIILWNVRPFESKNGYLSFPYEKREIGYYAILGPTGHILQAPTRLPKFTVLGQTDMPVEHQGALYWLSGGNGIRFVKFNLPFKGNK